MHNVTTSMQVFGTTPFAGRSPRASNRFGGGSQQEYLPSFGVVLVVYLRAQVLHGHSSRDSLHLRFSVTFVFPRPYGRDEYGDISLIIVSKEQ